MDLKKDFFIDLSKLYNYTSSLDKETASFLLDGITGKNSDFIKVFLSRNSIRICPDSFNAACLRLITKRPDALKVFLLSEGFSSDEILGVVNDSYFWTKGYYESLFKRVLSFIDDNNLLTPFYRKVFFHTNRIGLLFNSWLYSD